MNKRILWIAVICLLAGSAVLLYFPAVSLYETGRQQKEIEGFLQKVGQEDREDDRIREDGGEVHKQFPELYEEVTSYNERIFAEGQSDLTDAWSYEQPVFPLEDYGLEDGLFAVLTIPAMDVELPVYLGASMENMAKGAAILGQTSIPMGQKNCNSVIAAHRGYRGIPMFRDIEKLSLGDEVKIRTPWDTLIYRVSDIQVIEPDKIESVYIQEGQDRVTLITCHPYGESRSRWVVSCVSELGDEAQDEALQDYNMKWEEPDEGMLQKKLELYLPFVAIPLIILAIVLIFLPGKRG